MTTGVLHLVDLVDPRYAGWELGEQRVFAGRRGDDYPGFGALVVLCSGILVVSCSGDLVTCWAGGW